MILFLLMTIDLIDTFYSPLIIVDPINVFLAIGAHLCLLVTIYLLESYLVISFGPSLSLMPFLMSLFGLYSVAKVH
jgi:hypothetical protein